MKGGHLVFRVHAIQRMFERMITYEEVQHALATGKTFEAHPDDQSYPSRLVLRRSGSDGADWVDRS